MAFRFWYELGAGILAFVAILILGERGIAVLAILGFLPIIMRIKKLKPDERETQLFYKGTQFIFSALIFLIVASFVFTNIKISDILMIKKEMWFLILSGFLILNGLVRLFLLYKH